jgi:hypothetical protein
MYMPLMKQQQLGEMVVTTVDVHGLSDQTSLRHHHDDDGLMIAFVQTILH